MKNLLAVLIVLFAAHSVGFSQHLGSSIEKLSNEADMILTGKVVERESQWDAGKTKILTKVKIKVDEYLKDESNQKEIFVTQLGGEVGGIGEIYSHMPRFKNDEEVLLFLKKDKAVQNNYKVLNGEDGKITLYNDARQGERVTASNEKISVLRERIRSYVHLHK